MDTTRYYEGRINAKLITGAGSFSAGFIAYDANKSALNGGAIVPFIANGVTLTGAWSLLTGQVHGEGAGNNQFPTNTRFIKPAVFTNTANIGDTRLDALEIYEQPFNVYFIATDSRAWVAGNGWTNVTYDTVTSGNEGGWYNTSNGRFTAPVAGVYLCMAQHYVYPAASGAPYIHHVLGCNGANLGGCGMPAAYTIFGEGSGDGTYNSSTSVERMLFMNVGDYVQSNVYVNGGTFNYMYGQDSYFSCSLLNH